MTIKLSLFAAAALGLSFAMPVPGWGQTVDTRIGKIELEAGYPSKASAEKLFDEMDFQRATQAFIWALPAVGFHGLHLAQRNTFGAKDGEVVLYQTLKDKAGMLTPNLTTLYLMSFWNLAEQGPMVVEVPAGATAGGFLDVWQRPITDTGQTGPDRGGGGKYLIAPPESDIREMPGYIVARSPSNQVWFAARALDRDPKVAEEIARKHKVYAWKDRDNPGPTKFIPVGGKDWSSAQPVGLDYWRYLSEVLQPEPVDARDMVTMGMLVPLGIEKGKPFNPTDRQKKILADAAQLGELMARTNAFDKRFADATVWPGKKWEYANMVELSQDSNFYTQVDQRGSWFYEAIGNTVGMQGRILNFGQVYLETSQDKDGSWLDGGKTYACTFPRIHRWCSSGRSHSTTTRRVDRSSPIRARRTSRRVKSWRRTRMARWICTSDPPSPSKQRTGSRRFPARAGFPTSACTARRRRTSTRAGS
jgi:hypothetical protein